MACDIREDGVNGKRQPGHLGLTVVSYTFHVVFYSIGLLVLISFKQESNSLYFKKEIQRAGLSEIWQIKRNEMENQKRTIRRKKLTERTANPTSKARALYASRSGPGPVGNPLGSVSSHVNLDGKATRASHFNKHFWWLNDEIGSSPWVQNRYEKK